MFKKYHAKYTLIQR